MSQVPQRRLFSAKLPELNLHVNALSATPETRSPLSLDFAAEARPKRKHTSQACERCRAKRKRCDGGPRCQTCINANRECVYQFDDRRKTSVRQQGLQVLETRNEELRSVLDILKYGTDEDAFTTLRALRAQALPLCGQSYSNFKVDPGLSSPSVLAASSPDVLETVRDDHHSRVPCFSIPKSSEWPTLRALPTIFTPQNLPSEAIIRKGGELFFEVIAGLLHIMTVGEFNQLCDLIYRPQSAGDVLSLAELCAAAAIGAHYNFEDTTGGLKDALFETAVRYLPEMLGLGNLRTMKYLACLVAYGMIDKRRSNRQLIQLSLRVARKNLALPYHDSVQTFHDWKRLYRTMVCFECWLSSSLGYLPDIGTGEVEFTRPVASLSDDNSITQVKAKEIFMIKARVCKDICGTVPPTEQTIEDHMMHLERWYEELPINMTFPVLMNNEPSPLTSAEQGALLLSHAMYLGAVVMLHRRALIAVSDGILGTAAFASVWNARVQGYLGRSVDAARSIVRIFILLGFGRAGANMHVRCWICVSEIYTACTILLYNITLQIIQHAAYHAKTRLDLERVTACMGMLEASASVDKVSLRMRELLLPVYHAVMVSTGHRIDLSLAPQLEAPSLLNPRHANVSRLSFEPSRLVTPVDIPAYSCISAIPALRRATDILRDPYGHGSEAGFQLLLRHDGEDVADWWSTVS